MLATRLASVPTRRLSRAPVGSTVWQPIMLAVENCTQRSQRRGRPCSRRWPNGLPVGVSIESLALRSQKAWHHMAEERVQRRLVAILAADVVVYSRLMGADEEGTLETLNLYRAVFI